MLLILFLLGFLGYKALGWLTDRTTHDRQLVKWLRVSYCLRVLLAIALFNISYRHWPLGQSLQVPGGFWTFGIDAQAYHNAGRAMALAWQMHTAPPLLEPRQFLFSFIVAVVYRLCGVHVLYPIVLNAWWGTVCGLLAYLIAGRCIGQQARFPAAMLVAFWPSSFIWSSQLLKDPLTWVALLAALYLGIVWCQDSSRRPERRIAWSVGSWLCLLVAAIIMTELRFYLGVAFLTAVSVVVGMVILRAACRRHFKWEPHLAGLVLAIVLAVSFPSIWSPNQTQRTDGKTQRAPDTHLAAIEGRYEGSRPAKAESQTSNGVRDETGSGAVNVQEVSRETPHEASHHEQIPAIFKTLSQHFSALLNFASSERLLRIRQGFVSTGGQALVDYHVEIASPSALWWHLPKGLIIALLAPFPTQWFDTSGSTGVMRVFSSIEMFLLYLLYGILVLCVISGRTYAVFPPRDRGGFLLLTFTLLLMSAMALTVINVGTLFRLRLLFLFPFLILISGAVQWSVHGCFVRR